MKTLDFTPFSEEQFRTLAMYKARGYTWADIAQRLQLPVEQLEPIAWTHAKQWDRILTKAERHVARETLGEVVSTLRKDLHHAEPKLRPTLANSLTRAIREQQTFAPKKRPRRPAPPVTPVAPSEPISPTVAPPEPPMPAPPAITPLAGPSMEEVMAMGKAADEMFQRNKAQILARFAAQACAFVAFVCLCCLTLSRGLVTSGPLLADAAEPPTSVVVRVEQPQAFECVPPKEQTLQPTLALAPPWRAPALAPPERT